jgi:hypothetical protein
MFNTPEQMFYCFWSILMMFIYWGKTKYHEEKQRVQTDASKEVGLEVHTERIKRMFMSHYQNSGQNHNIKTGNRYFENVAKVKYLETACMHSLTHSLTCGAELFLRSCQLCSYSRTPQHFMEPVEILLKLEATGV